MDYLRNMVVIIAFGLVTSYIALFHLDLGNVWVYIYLIDTLLFFRSC